jgi:transcriptional regulator with XRE-family HTH domain
MRDPQAAIERALARTDLTDADRKTLDEIAASFKRVQPLIEREPARTRGDAALGELLLVSGLLLLPYIARRSLLVSLERGRYYAILGALVTRERKRKKLTQADLAKRLDVSQPAVARIEAGKLSVEVTLFRLIARVLFDVTHATLDARINDCHTLVARAMGAVGRNTRIASRDGERSLIDYVVEVAA